MSSICLLVVGMAAGTQPALAVTCAITSTGSVSFGSYNSLNGVPTDSVGNIVVDCDKEPKDAVATISSGNSGTSLQRKMANGGSFLNYNLYTNSSRTTVWGNGSSGTGVVTFGVKPQSHYVLPIYGRIPPLQNVPKGSYSDVLLVTITF